MGRRIAPGLAIAAAVGALAGCGAGSTETRSAASSPAASSPAANSTAASSTAVGTDVSATVASSTVRTGGAIVGAASPGAASTGAATIGAAPPGVLTTLTAATGTTPADLPGTGKPSVLLGDMNTPEQFIIGALYDDALSAVGYHVDLTRNVGPTAVSEAAVAEGSLDIYPEYLNVYDSQVMGSTRHFRTVNQAFIAAQRFANAHGQTLLTPTPFSDTAGIAVLRTYAQAHHLRSLADLRRVQSSLTLGSPLEFSAEPTGLPTLEHAYHFTPAVTTAINIGGQYGDLRFGAVQAAYVQTTDWQLAQRQYIDLPDIHHVLGFGNVVPVVSSKALDIEGPAFADAIDEVDALLTTSAIRGLQTEMKSATEPAIAAGDVASEFLQGNGIVPPPPWSTVTTTTPLPVALPPSTLTLTSIGTTSTSHP